MAPSRDVSYRFNLIKFNNNILISLSPLLLAIDVTDVTLGASSLWLETRTGAGDTATLTTSLAAAHASMGNKQYFQF